jgi:hypothetical protein
MLVSRILGLETSVFVYGLALIVAWKLLTSRINIRGLLANKSRPSQISPGRVQLLISTMMVAIGYLRNTAALEHGSFPQVGAGWLYLFGGSSLIYSARKAFEQYRRN